MQKNLCLRFAVIGIFLCLYSMGVAAKTIVVINSYHIGYPWSDRCFQGFSDYIGSEYNIVSYQMDTKRIPEHLYSVQAEKIWNHIIEDPPDLIVTMDDNALKYFGDRVVKEIGIPLVFMGINQNPRVYFPDHIIPQYVSGIIEKPLYEQNVIVISKILDMKKRKVLLLMDNGMTSKSISETAFFNRNSIFINEIQLDIDMADDYSDWKQKVLTASENYDALIISSYGRLFDIDNNQVSLPMVSEWTSLHSPLPVFSTFLDSVGKGKMIGGLVFTGYENGVGAAQIVNNIITTGKVPPIAFPKQGELVFSRSELLRWKIRLPKGMKKRAKFVQ